VTAPDNHTDVMSDAELTDFLNGLDKLRRKKTNRRYHENHRPQHRERKRRVRLEKRTTPKPFIGVDGEGAGAGEDHIYWLLRVGEATLYHDDGSALKSLEILKWLADLGEAGINDRNIPVGYFFDYDTTMILRGLSPRQIKELYTSSDFCLKKTCKHARELHWKTYGSCDVPGCDCRKCSYGGHTTIFLDRDAPDPEAHNCIQVMLRPKQLIVNWYKKKKFTVTDVAEFFQTSFLKTLDKWDVATPTETEIIRINKERRGNFQIGFDQETFDYNTLECELLSRIMEEFRVMCFANNLAPDMWTGPGRLAETLFQLEHVPMLEELDIPPLIAKLSDYAYYGGRAEGILYGEHAHGISLDIASAYPHAYTVLPCLVKGHGSWEEISFKTLQEEDLQNTMFIGRIMVRIPYSAPYEKAHPKVCGLPMRDTTGNITFPTEVYGCWWWPEVRETIKLYDKEGIRHKIIFEKAFTWRQRCDHKPGEFTERWYRKRLSVGKSTRGVPIKLTLNSLYGKAAQRVGKPKWANPVWAGLLTAITRARLLEATTLLGSDNIISFQTDGIFALSNTNGRTGERLSVYQGPEDETPLGAWTSEAFDYLFLIQSGVYSQGDGGRITNKTRGMRPFEFEQALDGIKEAWYDRGWFGEFALPNRTAFITLKLAIMWNKLELAGCWIMQEKKLDFYANTSKREIYDYRGFQDKWKLGVGDTIEERRQSSHELNSRPPKTVEDGRKIGITYAPTMTHALTNGRIYGNHPLIATRTVRPKGHIARVFDKTNMFSIPYSKELADALYQKDKQKPEYYYYVGVTGSYVPVTITLDGGSD
jgi:DNA polymerase type B, organellar and viral